MLIVQMSELGNAGAPGRAAGKLGRAPTTSEAGSQKGSECGVVKLSALT